MEVINAAEISVKVDPSDEYIVFPLRFTNNLPVTEIAKSHILPPIRPVHVSPPSVDFLNPVLVAAYTVFPEGSVGSASILGTELQPIVVDNSVHVFPLSVDFKTPLPMNWGDELAPPPP